MPSPPKIVSLPRLPFRKPRPPPHVIAVAANEPVIAIAAANRIAAFAPVDDIIAAPGVDQVTVGCSYQYIVAFGAGYRDRYDATEVSALLDGLGTVADLILKRDGSGLVLFRRIEPAFQSDTLKFAMIGLQRAHDQIIAVWIAGAVQELPHGDMTDRFIMPSERKTGPVKTGRRFVFVDPCEP